MPRMSIPRSLCRSVVSDFAGENTPPEKRALIRAEAKRLITLAVDAGLSPIIVADENSETGISENMSFPIKVDRYIRATQKEFPEMSYGNSAKGLLLSALLREDGASSDSVPEKSGTLERCSRAMGFESARQAQHVFFSYLNNALENSKIGMVEGATGIGKTLAIIAAASDQVERTGGNVAVTVPSLQLVAQFVESHRRLAAGGAVMAHPIPIVGRQEFVSVTAMRDAFETEGALATCQKEDISNAIDWIDGEGKPSGRYSETIGHKFLAASLANVAPSFPVDMVRLGQYNQSTPDGLDDPGRIAYLSQFHGEIAMSGEGIIYCTHAAIAMDILRRRSFSANMDKGFGERVSVLYKDARGKKKEEAKEKSEAIHRAVAGFAQLAVEDGAGHIPKYRSLVADEAHLLEANIANALCHNLSLLSFVGTLRKLSTMKAISTKDVKGAIGVLRELSKLAEEEKEEIGDALDLSRDGVAETARALLRKMVADLSISKKKKKTIPARVLETFERMIDAINLAAQEEDDTTIRRVMSFSPVRHYPSLSVGRKSVATELAYLWGLVDRGAACVSATLYFSKNSGIASAASYRALLNVPHHRAAEYRPVRPAWVTEPVVGLWTPHQKTAADRWLYPPIYRPKNAGVEAGVRTEAMWFEELASIIAGPKGIYQTSWGGVLVLCTAYSTVAGLEKLLLPEHGAERLVIARRGTSIAVQRDEFLSKSKNGKTIWLAVGAAWTGLDVGGSGGGINLLTDLVITRLPFKQNRTATHETRVAKYGGWSSELLSAVMLYRQGIGRLVRSDDLPKNRRIFLLDARINDQGFAGNAAVFLNENAAYPQKRLTMETMLGGDNV